MAQTQQQEQRTRAPVPTYIICILVLLGLLVFVLALGLYSALSAGLDELIDGDYRPTLVIDKEGFLLLREKDLGPFARAQIKTAVKRQKFPGNEADELLRDEKLYELVETLSKLYTRDANAKELVQKVKALKETPGVEAKFNKVFSGPFPNVTALLPKRHEQHHHHHDHETSGTQPKSNFRGGSPAQGGPCCALGDVDVPEDLSAVPEYTEEELHDEVDKLQKLAVPDNKGAKGEEPAVGENPLAATAGGKNVAAGGLSKASSDPSLAPTTPNGTGNGVGAPAKEKAVAPPTAPNGGNGASPDLQAASKGPSDGKANVTAAPGNKEVTANVAVPPTPK